MNLEKRIGLLLQLRQWLSADEPEWKETKNVAYQHNKWFIPEFINHRINVLLSDFLNEEKLDQWVAHYHIDDNVAPKKVGIVMAGNIPLVGFHDLLCCFVTGHHSLIKYSDKDSVLLKKILAKMTEFDGETANLISSSDMLLGCDAYIATGSNNSSRYFEYYFGKYPSVIRKNRTSVAILDGDESDADLTRLADDVFLYFGLGCRNVTQIYVPENYDFVPLLKSFEKYRYLRNHSRFGDNYDYNLALLIMNKRPYMSNDCVVLVNEDQLFSPVSELYYAFYQNRENLLKSLRQNPSVQCIVGGDQIRFGAAQETGLFDYADGVDTVEFLLGL